MPEPSRTAREARLLALLGTRAASQDETRAIASVDDITLDRWLASLERYEGACGCKSGAALSLLTLVFWPLVALRRRRVSTVRGAVGALGNWAGAVLAGALAGKLGGLAVAAVARRSLIRRITANLGDELRSEHRRERGQREHRPNVVG